MVKTQLFIGLALLVGVAVGYFVHGENRAPVVVASPAETPRGVVADAGEAASVRALRARVAELEKQLASQHAKAEEDVSNAVATAVQKTAGNRRPWGNPRQWMENLKKNDPVRYAQITNRMEQGRRRRQDRQLAKREFLASIDTSHMSAAAQKTHSELQELLQYREELEAKLHQEEITDAERRNLMDEMRQTDRKMQELNRSERSNLLEEAAKNLGFAGEAAQEVSATVQEVIEATEGGHHMGPPPPNGP